ncbi:DUF58 domain-containing protein [Treponema sp.]|uniref:DUF58 domain-containing protein n=1 Tax=Treponema sp. TaxID=166 RepID=UPI003EFE01FB
MKNDISRRASLLHLSSLSLAEKMKSGSFRSLYRGHGIEFSGVREYLRGDDVRAIDWNVTARMGKPFVKMFEEERELDVFIIVDSSLSMAVESGRQTKLEKAMECASLLTLASFYNSSPVGAVVFDGALDFFCSPESGKKHALMLLSHFENEKRKIQPGSVLNSALRAAEKLLKKRSLVFVISDFRTVEWQASFARLCQKNDVIAIRIVDALDSCIPSVGSVLFSDPETGYEAVLPTSSKKFVRRWREENEQRTENWSRDCIRHGGIPLFISTVQDPAAELIKFFTSRHLRSI